MTSASMFPPVSVVIIGRNEAANIRNCIQSALEMDYPKDLLEAIYVDTGSTDGTLEIARTTGIKVVEVVTAWPSAALARNAGLVESSNRIIHFVDGDMTIDPHYLKKAVLRLLDGDVSSVFGRVIERHADTNWIARMLNTDWKRKETGLNNAPGGGGTFIKTALEKIGGYNSCLPMTEETDVGIRLRKAGHRILLIDTVMATHDYGVNTVGQLLTRFYRSGKARFKILLCDDVPPEIRKWCWVLPKQAAAVLALILLLMASGFAYAVLFLLTAYPVVYIVRVIVADWKLIITNKHGLDAFLGSYSYYISKPVVLLGMISEFSMYTLKKNIKTL